MRIQHHLLTGSRTLGEGALDGASLNLVRSRGRGNRLQVPAGWVSVCLVLGGVLELRNHDADWTLHRGRYQLWPEGSLRCASPGLAWWLALTGPAALWRPGARATAIDMLPWEAGCPRAVMRPLVRLARGAGRAEDAGANAALLVELRQAVLEDQQCLHAHLQRCSGRTRLRRQQTLLRLLRVQHLIRCHLHDHMALSRLAASASYSPCHLVRLYRNVFGETPNEYAARLRCERAWELVCATPMPVCEVAETLGFENESAFCRAFRQAFGCTATSARRNAIALRPSGVAHSRLEGVENPTAGPDAAGAQAVAHAWSPQGGGTNPGADSQDMRAAVTIHGGQARARRSAASA